MHECHSRRIRYAAPVAAAILATMTSGFALAQANRTDENNRRQKDTAKEHMDREVRAPELQRASKIIGLNVVDSAGEKIGSINNLAIDLNSGHVYYAVISSGGVA